MRPTTDPFDPWTAAERVEGLVVRWTRVASLMGGAFAARSRSGSVIGLDPELRGHERRAALTHELVHLERGLVLDPPDGPCTWAAVVGREEARVDREVARRLAPAEVVAEIAHRLIAGGEPVTAGAVAAELEVPLAIAGLALVDLERCGSPGAAAS